MWPQQAHDLEHGSGWTERKTIAVSGEAAESRLGHLRAKTHQAPEKQLPQDERKRRTEPEGLGLETEVTDKTRNEKFEAGNGIYAISSSGKHNLTLLSHPLPSFTEKPNDWQLTLDL